MRRLTSPIVDGLRAVVASVFERPGGSRLQPLVFATASVGLYVLGLLRWAWFSSYGKISFLTGDWYKERAYYTVLQRAFETWTIPFHTNLTFYGSHRFLALPEVVLSPQILLLKVVDSLGTFVLLHFLVLYTVGFLGCLAVQRRFRLSTFAFACFLGLFTFNGYITAHLAVGHTMWGGYFFLPWFFLTLADIAQRRGSDLSNALALAFVLFFILLQGSLHVVAACTIYTVLFAIFNPATLRVFLLSVPAAAVLNTYRLVPAAVTFKDLDTHFLSGYPTLVDVVRALVVIERPSTEMVGGLSGALYWWEMDVFIGLIGLGFLLYFGVYRGWNRDEAHLGFSAFNLPNAVMAVLAINHFYFLVAKLPIPFAGVERVPSRFLILPIIALLMISVVRLDDAMGRLRGLGVVHAVAIFCLVETYLELMTHLRHWNVAAIDVLLPPAGVLDIHAVDMANDAVFVRIVGCSYLVSAVGVVICGALLVWAKRSSRSAAHAG